MLRKQKQANGLRKFNLTDLLTLSVAVNRINDGYIKKDANIETDDEGCQKQWPIFLLSIII